MAGTDTGYTNDETHDRPLIRFLPLLMGAMVAVHAALAGITITTDEPTYELLVHGLATLGIALSLVGIILRRNFSVVGSAVLVLSLAAYALRFRRGLQVMVLAYPAEVLGEPELSLAVLCGWFLVGFCFMLGRRQNIVFVFVAGLAVLGLMATSNLNIEFLLTFMTFVAATVYCWGYEHFAGVVKSGQSPINWWYAAKTFLSRSSLVFVATALAGLLLGNLLFFATPGMYGDFHLGPRIWNFTAFHARGYFTFRHGFKIGNGPIRLSRAKLYSVTADRSYLWRGKAYDRYNGRGWERSITNTRLTKRLDSRTFALREEGAPPEPKILRESAEDRRSRPAAGTGESAPAPPSTADRPTKRRPQGEPAAAKGPRDRSRSNNDRSARPKRRLRPPAQADGTAPERQLPEPDWQLEPLKGNTVRQSVEILNSDTSAVIAASFPFKLRMSTAPGGRSMASSSPAAADAYGAVQTRSVMRPKQTYTIWSKYPDFSPDQLRNAPDENYTDDFRQRYIEQNSIAVATELGPLVEKLTANADTDYDKAMAIHDYLQQGFVYTLDVPRTPSGRDAVVYFVKESRRGACDLFASAMVLMCRLAEVPARIATGFNRGNYSSENEAWIIRGLDAHAWAEIYFPDYGWVPFNVSAGSAENPGNWLALVSAGQWKAAARNILGLLAWGIVMLAGLYLVTTAIIDPRRYLSGILQWWGARDRPMLKLSLQLRALLRHICRTGQIPYRNSLTPKEIIDRAAETEAYQTNQDILRRLQELVSRFYALRYRGDRPSEEIEKLRSRIKRARVAIKKAGLS